MRRFEDLDYDPDLDLDVQLMRCQILYLATFHPGLYKEYRRLEKQSDEEEKALGTPESDQVGI